MMTGETSGIRSTLRRLHLPSGNRLSLNWMMTLSVAQIVATLIFASLFFISHDLHQISSCVLFITNMGYAQYNFVSLGTIIAGTMYQSILCLEALYQRRASCLYAMLGFQLWLAAYSGIQSYQRHAIMQQAASCHNDSSITPNEPLATYSLVGITGVSFLLALGLAIYLRRSFQQSLNPVHAALESLLKLDFYLSFSYGTQLLPLPLMTADDPILSIPELIFIFAVSCLLFLLAWSMVLVTWQPLPWWRIMINMIGLGLVCLGSIVYVCYRLVRFMPDPRTLSIRPALLFSSLILLVALLLTMSIVTTCAAHQWQTCRLLVPSEEKIKDHTHNDDDDGDNDSAHMFMTPQTSRII